MPLHQKQTGDGQQDGEEYIALCLAIKDQSLDLLEWLTHHYHHLGIRRFYIMDDGSSPPLSELTLPIPASAVTFQYIEPAERQQWMQLHVYNTCAKMHGHKHTWMGFIDADEFLEVREPETLKSILEELDKDETVGALGVNWQIHTSSGLLKRPTSARKSFTDCISDPPSNHGIETGTENEHIKSLVKMKYYKQAANPHKFHLLNDTVTVGERGDEIEGKAWRIPASREKIAIHHYSVKSLEEFEQKMNRSNGMNDPKGWAQWDKIHGFPKRKCEEMALYNP
jgi:hypothetical protein